MLPFRIISFIEGLSYLYLLFCSLYLKRVLGNEHAIDTPGMIHGVLFILFCAALLYCLIQKKVNFNFSVLAFFLSLLPFGFLWIEKHLKDSKTAL